MPLPRQSLVSISAEDYARVRDDVRRERQAREARLKAAFKTASGNPSSPGPKGNAAPNERLAVVIKTTKPYHHKSGNTKSLTVRFTQENHDALQTLSKKLGVSKNAVLNLALQDLVLKYGVKQ